MSRIAPRPDRKVRAALAWLVDHQQGDGLWKTSCSRIHKPPRDTAKDRETRLWIALVVCGFLKRFRG